ncbi:MAG: aliphatic sulfonate ABC transporter substrate-binding protein [Novosphingobium sp.]|jgi:sulfonate transport system substrate-binding protein|uniref:aliphatic sulfonate ABC transporter substrate-binding protein n=1 Tax=Novosphingobium sp. TaxID=1874826 RepID=UPI0022C0EFFF|nr:aliphatic sulfonate ABC transporter substrate-binding protein [Novosphingobium sp.]MCZ8036211.1 aliphatic sulfonate ABC transporter substrate-binding protein [Novosphingobium sp.]
MGANLSLGPFAHRKGPRMIISRRFALAGLAASLVLSAGQAFAQAPKEIRVDFATYNPVSLVLKDSGILEKALAADGITVRWVQSAGSNKALEFLNAGSLDFGSTAGAAALIGKINGNPIKTIYVYSRPEWTALVTGAKSDITKVADLKGKRVAVTRGTDPHIFLVRALAEAKLTEKDVKLVLLQHADGRLALERGDVDAWAGLDPLMAAAEVESGAKLFHRKAADNTWGVLNVREAFAKDNPALVRKVLAAYEEARAYALANPAELKKTLVAYTKLSDAVIERQLTRTELTHATIGQAQAETIIAAGLALQEAGVVPAKTDVKAVVDDLLDRRFAVTN